jgi:hypothetical protein
MKMIMEHPVWFAITMLVVAWYSSVTIYVAIRGAFDIRQMLQNLAERHEEEHATRRDGEAS